MAWGPQFETLETRRLLSAELLVDVNQNANEEPSHVPPVSVGSTVYFVSKDAATGFELWKSDGTPTGTLIVKDIVPGPESATISNLVAVGNRVFFQTEDGETGYRLWCSDGTAEGTVPIHDAYSTAFTVLGDYIYF